MNTPSNLSEFNIVYIYTKQKEENTRDFNKLKCLILAGRVKKAWLKMSDAKNMTTLIAWTERFFDMEEHIRSVLNNQKIEKISLSEDVISRLKNSQQFKPQYDLHKGGKLKPLHLRFIIEEDISVLKNNLLSLYKSNAFKTQWIESKTKPLFVNDMNAALSSCEHLTTSPNVIDFVNTGSLRIE
jgi:hypothetical protein